MKKRTLSMLLALVMCLSLAVPALASSIQPRVATCSECGGEVTTKYSYSAWKYQSVECDMVANETDKQAYRTVTATYSCTSCGDQNSYSYTEYGDIICNHG